jgi:hypothetical protein
MKLTPFAQLGNLPMEKKSFARIAGRGIQHASRALKALPEKSLVKTPAPSSVIPRGRVGGTQVVANPTATPPQAGNLSTGVAKAPRHPDGGYILPKSLATHDRLAFGSAMTGGVPKGGWDAALKMPGNLSPADQKVWQDAFHRLQMAYF